MRRFFTPFLALVGAMVPGFPDPAPQRVATINRWAVCYSDSPSPASLAAYDVVVLDPDSHPSLGPVVGRGRTALAYVSLTQIDGGRRYFPALREAGAVQEQHPVWTDAHYLDLRHPAWRRTVLEDLVPRAIEEGFTGLFFDTLDDVEFLESRDPARWRGLQQAAVALVQAIRGQYPSLVLMVNRGYALMPSIAKDVDILLGESVLSSFDSASGTYHRLPPDDAAWQIAALRRARQFNPRLRLLTLDYWDDADVEGVRRLYLEQRANGFVPYVSIPALDRIVEHTE
jgi:uncharacterized protein (TIGR01370 family)